MSGSGLDPRPPRCCVPVGKGWEVMIEVGDVGGSWGQAGIHPVRGCEEVYPRFPGKRFAPASALSTATAFIKA
jgi:hypothetical protein